MQENKDKIFDFKIFYFFFSEIFSENFFLIFFENGLYLQV